MGVGINAAYQQFMNNVAAVGGKAVGAPGKAPQAAKKAQNTAKRGADRADAYTGSGLSLEFSSEGMAALGKARQAKKAGAVKADAQSSGGAAAANEAKLSDKAKKYLDSLREKYGDYDFMVGDESDDLDDLLSGATKEFSVIFSNEDLERMAEDEDYAKEKMAETEKAIETAKNLTKEIGFGAEDENGVATGTFFRRLGVIVGDDGKVSIFADLERITAKQQENAEKAREAKAAEEKDAEKKEAKEKGADREDYSVKLTRIQGSSAEELLELFRGVDWDAVEEA